MKDDIIYLVLLGSCIGFGQFYKKFHDKEQKKWIGTGFGLLVILSVSGFHTLHMLFCYLVTSLIIIFANRKSCHLIAFGFMFGYLFFFRSMTYLGFEAPPGHANMIIMILTLKLVGLAFEVNSAFQKSKGLGQVSKKDDSSPQAIEEPLTENEKALLKIDMLDVLHYAFNYVGVLTGPYYTFKTYRDAIYLPFSTKADCVGVTLEKLKVIPLYAGLFLLVSYIWPLDYATSTEFYEERSFFYRLMYTWPTFFIFRMRIYTGILLSECVCTMAGFGAYPKICQNKSGHGPAKDCTAYVSSDLDAQEYDFETVRNIDVINTEKCWTFREAMKYWNMCVQYWMAMYVYKRFPSKAYRTLATLVVSAIWHGVYAGYYFCICGAPFYLPIEDLYVKLFIKDATGTKRRVLNVICWFMKFFSLGYLGTAFLLLTIGKIWYYYNSVYHFGYVLWIVLYGVGVLIAKNRKAQTKRADKEQKVN
ncbi:lysophospholipid acyltransferase 7 [Uranotaenia lowii]|uniref:lysophospholipid acyltransferase 7 n=1 Tax=Uranotaenia lowii TaxID=190385 RepID=UPI0024795AF9|nr:lysophospholipid acyltransferase 7 [Uranotaenia lowii]XP_055595423.1 lysophospholipid acyltransferase 7 [Uranotaenia lowii]